MTVLPGERSLHFGLLVCFVVVFCFVFLQNLYLSVRIAKFILIEIMLKYVCVLSCLSPV